MPPTPGSRSSTRKVKGAGSVPVIGDKAAEGTVASTKLRPRSSAAVGAAAAATAAPKSSASSGYGASTAPRTARARKSALSSSPLKNPTLSTPTSSSGSSSSAHNIPLSLSSHPRTDPLSALSTLLRLLRSLPGRIGGCAYKLSPAEHALAVHLVGVLDPFVFRGYRASSSSLGGAEGVGGVDAAQAAAPLLLQQPTEILDAVLAHLDTRRDVLSLGMACKRLWEVVSPRHLEYRLVRARPSNVAVWAHLVRHRDLARNVRRLEVVVDERLGFANANSGTGMLRVPRTLLLSRDTDHDSTDDELALHVKYRKYLSAALARMPGLTAFSWGVSPSSPSSTSSSSSSGAGGRAARGAGAGGSVRLADIWNLLLQNERAGGGSGGGVGKGLRELVVLDNFVFQPVVEEEEESTEEEEEEEEEESEEESEEGSEESSEDEEGANPHPILTSAPVAMSRRRKSKSQLARPRGPVNFAEMQTSVFRSTPHAYGAPKQPELGRIAGVLHRCVNLKNLEITYIAPRSPPASPLTPAAGGGVGAAAALGTPHRTRPLADDLLSYTRLPQLTHLALVNLRCTSPEAVAGFLAAHERLEVLVFEVGVHAAAAAATGGGAVPGAGVFKLGEGSLPVLREVRASKEVINAILECPLPPLPLPEEVKQEDDDEQRGEKKEVPQERERRRPLEVLKGFKLSGSYTPSSPSSSSSTPASSSSIANPNAHHSTRNVPDARFLSNLRLHASSIRRVEMAGWHDMEDIRRLVGCLPRLVWLDVGRKLGGVGGPSGTSGGAGSSWGGTGGREGGGSARGGGGGGGGGGPVANLTEWTEVLGGLPDLVALHGVRFFYEVSSAAMGLGYDESDYSSSAAQPVDSSGGSSPPITTTTTTTTNAHATQHQHQYQNLSMMERSRMRKNDEIAGVLAWKCRKLRRVDHWEAAYDPPGASSAGGWGVGGSGAGAGAGKVIVLVREGKEVRWEVRRVR